jgi:flap endonuclease-1
MLRNITSHRMKESSLVTISGLEVRRALEIPTQRAYIDFALLLGTDFTERIKNLGPIAAHKLIKEYGSIENVIKLIQGEDVQPTTSKKKKKKEAPIIAVGEQETNVVVKKLRKSKRVAVRKAPPSRYTIRYPLSEYLAHVHMGREVYSTHPPTPAKRLLKQKPQDDVALSALLREWGIDRELLDRADDLLEGQVWRLGEGYDWQSGEDGDIFRRFGGSVDWVEPWEGDPAFRPSACK